MLFCGPLDLREPACWPVFFPGLPRVWGKGWGSFAVAARLQTRIPERVEMGERILWVTIALNRLLGKPVSALLEALHIHPANPEYPIPNHVAVELVAFALAAVFF